MSQVSVVIPCFNLGRYLPEAIESIRQQTVAPREVIIVDDGSTDQSTVDIVERYRAEGLTIYRTDNHGAPAARNFGIERAVGQFILCLDADDVLMPSYLEMVAPVLANKRELGIVTPYVEFFGNCRGVWKTLDYDPAALLSENCISSASLFRKCCWQQVDGYFDLPAFQDWDFWISIMEAGWKWTVVPEPLYRYRVRSNSISEYGRAHRSQLLRTIIERHAASYQLHLPDILTRVDSELRTSRALSSKYAQDNAAQAEAINNLRSILTQIRADLKGELDSNDSMSGFLETCDSPEEAFRRSVRMRVVAETRELIEGHTLPGSTILVVSRGDDELLRVESRQAWHFPQVEGGIYAGHHPADSKQAIEQVEQLRSRGADYLVFPASSMWWLDHYHELADYLESQCEVIHWNASGAVVALNTRLELPQNTFSVVICTYNRAQFVGKAIESVFAQNYPSDKFELIVINNDSPDNTELVVGAYTDIAPIPFACYVEKRNGLSYARNLGISKARCEYVVHLDDDAVAVPNWLASFNSVINGRHALVVGGRVEKAFEEGFVPPDWFNFQYMQGFFGINYREWGKQDAVFRIRHPLYIGGGNSAYAKWLYRYFGGYDPRLGRDSKTLLAGEETYLNMVMDRCGIPMYYTDDAAIYHFIETYRVTKQHLRKKAIWGGLTNAILYTMFFGVRETLRRTRQNIAEIKKLRKQCLASPTDPQNFSRRCRIRYNLAFLKKFYAIRLRRLAGSKIFRPKPVAWDPQARTDELNKLPCGVDKYFQLYHFHRAMGNSSAARQAYAELRPYLTRVDRREEKQLEQGISYVSAADDGFAEAVCRIVEEVVPPEARVLVISKGDPHLLGFKGRRGEHFPQNEMGEYSGYHPADSNAATEHLVALCNSSPVYLVIPHASHWWFEHYDAFYQHLVDYCGPAIHDSKVCMIFAVCPATRGCNEPQSHFEPLGEAVTSGESVR